MLQRTQVISSNLWRLISLLPTAVFLCRTKECVLRNECPLMVSTQPLSRGFPYAQSALHPGCPVGRSVFSDLEKFC